MERHEKPYTWFEHQAEDENENIPRARFNGWILLRKGKEERLLKVRTVRAPERVRFEVLYPVPEPGYEIFEDDYFSGQIQRLPEQAALAWLEAHGLPIPGSHAHPTPDNRAHEDDLKQHNAMARAPMEDMPR